MIFGVAAMLLVAALDAWRNGPRAWAAVLVLAILPTLATTIGFAVALVLLAVYATFRIVAGRRVASSARG